MALLYNAMKIAKRFPGKQENDIAVEAPSTFRMPTSFCPLHGHKGNQAV